MSATVRIILASSSPRRAQLMEQIGIPCEVIASDADENAAGTAHEQVEQLARRKAAAVRQKITGEALIIAADTLVTIDGRVLSKPAGEDDALDMLTSLSGRKHTVYTGVALILVGKTDTHRSFLETAHVYFRPLSQREIRAYIATGEPFDKAGAYGVQGRGAALVSRIEGDFYAVMGLPVSRLCAQMADLGVDIWACKIRGPML